jgi:hypothetical protein
MFERILIPLDGSQTSERILSRVAPLVAPGAIRQLLTVVPGADRREPTPAQRLRLLEAESDLFVRAAPAAPA